MKADADLFEEIVRHVLIEASFRERQREAAQERRDVLEALQELTVLPRAELEEIIMKFRGFGGSCERDRDTFFSVNQQVIVLSAMLAVICCVFALFIWMCQ